MDDKMTAGFTEELDRIRESGLYKKERIIRSDQKAGISVSFPPDAEPREVLNFCANNYLGLANHPDLIRAARDTLDRYGLGLASVRFICGTQDIHTRLEQTIARFYRTGGAILYSSCFDANGGLFESILGAEDAVVTDELNHASIIDGIRLCKARRYIYAHSDMESLGKALRQARDEQGAHRILIATDGVFSMDGDIARLKEIVDAASDYDAMVMVDDSHATGFMGESGRGSVEHCGVLGKVDIITSTLGKAMGGASGGFTTGRAEIIDLLRQKSRPYLFSNTLAPALVGSALKAFEVVEGARKLREKLWENTAYFREKMQAAGFDIIPGVHPIVPIMLGKFPNDAALAQDMAADLYAEGIYVVGFFYPVVPKKKARIRVQISAAHNRDHIDSAIQAFITVGRKHGVI